ncbi:MAG: amino acid ABC transporter permease [Sedimentibacter sp.]
MLNINTNTSFWDRLWNARTMIFDGLSSTLIVSFGAIILGTILGVIIGLIITYGNKYIKLPFKALVDIVRGLPLLVTIFIIYYYLDFILKSIGITMSPMLIGIIALMIFCSAQVSELVRGALQNIPKQQIDAGRALGMRFPQILKDILLPQALVEILPPWVNSATEIVKGSTLLSLVSISELMLVGKQLVAKDPRALAYYSIIGLIYFTINTIIEFGGRTLENKVSFVKK